MFQKILVAVDDSDHAHRAVTVASDLATHYHSSLCLLHAFPHIADHIGSPAYDRLVERATMRGRELLDEMCATIADSVPVETQLIEGTPAAAILRVAQTEGFDLIVLGSRGHSHIASLLLGSVSSAVTQKAQCPVMVIH